MQEKFEIIYHHNKRWQKCKECNFESQVTDIAKMDKPTIGMKKHLKNANHDITIVLKRIVHTNQVAIAQIGVDVERLKKDREDLWHFINEQSSLIDEMREKIDNLQTLKKLIDNIQKWINEQQTKKDMWD